MAEDWVDLVISDALLLPSPNWLIDDGRRL
jgi:hypothetical protein